MAVLIEKRTWKKRMSKKCSKCGEVKLLEEFHRKSQSSDGRSSHCKACRAKHYAGSDDVQARRVKYYKENSDKMRVRKVRQRKENPEKTREDDARYRGRYPERVKARKAVYHAMRAGWLVKPKVCSMCPVGEPEAHHKDYSRPLDIVWLCKECHVVADRSFLAESANSSSQKAVDKAIPLR